jgi:hypothetical protein
MRIQLIRFELLREVAKLESKIDSHAPWPKKVVTRMTTISAEQTKMREEWLRLGCAEQLHGHDPVPLQPKRAGARKAWDHRLRLTGEDPGD